ncbi:MAG: hypothetical protein ACRDNZ_23740, partial [Streptosporangiaceae bacterium]
MTSQAQADAAADPEGAVPGDHAAPRDHAVPSGAATPSDDATPTWSMTESQLADLELLLSGAFAPLDGFMTAADVAAVMEAWRLADGTPFPIPVTLDIPADAIPADASHLALADPEGTPLAILRIIERSPMPPGATPADTTTASDGAASLVRLAGPVTASRVPEHGPFRRLMLTPAQARAEIPGGPLLAWAGRGPLHGRQIGQLRHLAGQLKARILVLPLVAGPAEVVTRPESLVRATLAAAASLPSDTQIIPVPLAPRPQGAAGQVRELAIRARVAAAFGATHLMAESAELAELASVAGGYQLPGAPILVLP